MGEYTPIGEEKSAEAKAEKKRSKKNPWLLAVAIVAISGPGYFWEYDQHVEIASQKSKMDALETKLTEKENQIRDQRAELLPLRDYAIGKFGGDESQALAQLAKDLQKTFRPLDAPSRKKVIAAFSAVRTQFGTNLTSVELMVESSNLNCRLLADEWVSILKDAGYKAFVGGNRISTAMDTTNPFLFEYYKDQFQVLRAFVNEMPEFAITPTFGATNVAERGVLIVHIIGEPSFSPDGHVTFGEALVQPHVRSGL